MGGWWWHSRIESLQVLSTLDLDCDNIFVFPMNLNIFETVAREETGV